MRKFGISEVEAAEYVAKMLDYYRGIAPEPEDPKPKSQRSSLRRQTGEVIEA